MLSIKFRHQKKRIQWKSSLSFILATQYLKSIHRYLQIHRSLQKGGAPGAGITGRLDLETNLVSSEGRSTFNHRALSPAPEKGLNLNTEFNWRIQSTCLSLWGYLGGLRSLAPFPLCSSVQLGLDITLTWLRGLLSCLSSLSFLT